jgi:hypothetical protein
METNAIIMTKEGPEVQQEVEPGMITKGGVTTMGGLTAMREEREVTEILEDTIRVTIKVTIKVTINVTIRVTGHHSVKKEEVETILQNIIRITDHLSKAAVGSNTTGTCSIS